EWQRCDRRGWRWADRAGGYPGPGGGTAAGWAGAGRRGARCLRMPQFRLPGPGHRAGRVARRAGGQLNGPRIFPELGRRLRADQGSRAVAEPGGGLFAASWYAWRGMGISVVVTLRPGLLRACMRRGGPVALAAVALLGTAAAQAPGTPARAAQLGGARQAPAGTSAVRVPTTQVPPPGAHSGGSPAASGPVTTVASLGKLLRADVLIVSHKPLPAQAAARVDRLPGVQAARAVDAARIQVNGKYSAILGVDPSTFRAFAAGPTARASRLWQSVAAGGIAVSYTMGKQDKLPLGGTVRVSGRTVRTLRVGGFGTVGIGGVDAVVSDSVARSLG